MLREFDLLQFLEHCFHNSCYNCARVAIGVSTWQSIIVWPHAKLPFDILIHVVADERKHLALIVCSREAYLFISSIVSLFLSSFTLYRSFVVLLENPSSSSARACEPALSE